VPNDIAGVVHQDTVRGSDKLTDRGYTRISSDHHNGQTVEYWWQGKSSTCVQARARGGKYEELSVTTPTDCNQYQTQATKNNNAAAIAVGAAALIGVAALAHQSHDRDGKHDNDSKSVAEFDRGYRDGLHHEGYHNYNNTPAYSDGYSTGQRERDDETPYRSHQGHHSGYQPYVALDDLVGVRASSADAELRSRGFKNIDGYKKDNKAFATWYNKRTRQCVQAVTKNGEIRHIDPLAEGNCT
jgi:hypothetical protein